jgi:hypothetical protein
MGGAPSELALTESAWPYLPFGEPIALIRDDIGDWIPTQQTRQSIVRPWGFGPLGYALTSEQQVRVAARATGYKTLAIIYSPSWCRTPAEFMKQFDSSPHAALLQMDESGTLTINLPRK